MERQPGKLTCEVDGVLLSIDRVMERGVGVGKYLLRRD